MNPLRALLPERMPKPDPARLVERAVLPKEGVARRLGVEKAGGGLRVVEDGRKLKARPTRELFDAQDVRDGVVELGENSWAAGIAVSPMNWEMMTPEEQEAVQLGLMRLVATFTFPVQVVISKRRLDLWDTIGGLRERAESLGQKSRAYALYLAEALETHVLHAKWALEERRYLIVRFDAPKDMPTEGALGELRRRQGMVQRSLEGIGFACRPMVTADFLELIRSMLHKGQLRSTVRAAEEYGFLAPVVRRAPLHLERG